MDSVIEEYGGVIIGTIGTICIITTVIGLLLNNGVLAQYITYVIESGS